MNPEDIKIKYQTQPKPEEDQEEVSQSEFILELIQEQHSIG